MKYFHSQNEPEISRRNSWLASNALLSTAFICSISWSNLVSLSDKETVLSEKSNTSCVNDSQILLILFKIACDDVKTENGVISPSASPK